MVIGDIVGDYTIFLAAPNTFPRGHISFKRISTMEGTRNGARRHRRRACGCPSNGFGLRGDNGALALDTGCVSDHCVSYCHPLCWLKGCFLSALLLLARGASSSAPLRRASVLPVWANDMHQRTAKATGARAREPSDYYSNSALTSATGHHASNPDTSTLTARRAVDDIYVWRRGVTTRASAAASASLSVMRRARACLRDGNQKVVLFPSQPRNTGGACLIGNKHFPEKATEPSPSWLEH